MRRLFVGISVSEELKRNIAPFLQEIQEVGGPLAVVPVGNLHLTLKFFGGVGHNLVPKIQERLLELKNSLNGKKLALRLQGVGVFPDQKNPKILWVGGGSEIIPLMQEAERIFADIAPKEYEKDVPHITVARAKAPVRKEVLLALLNKYKNHQFGNMIVGRITLFESIPTTKGSVYKPMYDVEV